MLRAGSYSYQAAIKALLGWQGPGHTNWKFVVIAHVNQSDVDAARMSLTLLKRLPVCLRCCWHTFNWKILNNWLIQDNEKKLLKTVKLTVNGDLVILKQNWVNYLHFTSQIRNYTKNKSFHCTFRIVKMWRNIFNTVCSLEFLCSS